jgi:MOSC domain-containing protein YiiM
LSAPQIEARVTSVNVSPVETFPLPGGESRTSGIRKRPQSAPVAVGLQGFRGDASHDPAHGGPNRAVHVFSTEHYLRFQARAERSIDVPLVGENLTVSGFPDAVAHVGDVVRVGTTLLQVTMPTERCRYPGLVSGLPQLLKWMIEELRTGYYLRVLEAGVIGPGDAWVLEDRRDQDWSIEALSRVMYQAVGDARLVAQLEACELLATEWRRRLRILHDRKNG